MHSSEEIPNTSSICARVLPFAPLAVIASALKIETGETIIFSSLCNKFCKIPEPKLVIAFHSLLFSLISCPPFCLSGTGVFSGTGIFSGISCHAPAFTMTLQVYALPLNLACTFALPSLMPYILTLPAFLSLSLIMSFPFLMLHFTFFPAPLNFNVL